MKKFLLLSFGLMAVIQLKAQTTVKEVKLIAPSGDLIHFNDVNDILTFSRAEFFAQLPPNAELDRLMKQSWFMPAGDTLFINDVRQFFWKCFPEDPHVLGKAVEKCLTNGTVSIRIQGQDTDSETVYLLREGVNEPYRFRVAADPQDETTIFVSQQSQRWHCIGNPSF